VGAGDAPRAPEAAKKKAAPVPAEARPALEPKAIDILKAASDRLTATLSMAFTAVITYESPSRHGQPLAYTTTSDVTLQRPDKLRVITSGDGPASEFYYDGKTMVAFSPAENLAAVAAAPPTTDAAPKVAYDSAAIYFPFTRLILADPYGHIAKNLKFAYYIGQSHVIGGTTTDMVAYGSEEMFDQIWIGAEDKLPRLVRIVFRNDPLQLRTQLELSNWRLNLAVPPDAFASSRAVNATRIAFARPDPKRPPGAKLPVKGKPPGIE